MSGLWSITPLTQVQKKITQLEIPNSVGNLESLISIDLSYTSIDQLPVLFRNCVNLKVLKMERYFLREFPDAIAELKKLEEINFSSCRSLTGKICCGSSTALRILRLSHTQICSLPANIGALYHLQNLNLIGCRKLLTLPDLPAGLVTLRAGSQELKVVPNLSYLASLKELHLHINAKSDSSEISPDFEWISNLLKLETLDLSFTELSELRLPGSFVALSQLKKLTLSFVDLQHLPQLPSSLSRLSLQNCSSLNNSPALSNIHGLLELEVSRSEMAEICGLRHLEALQILKVSYCSVRTLDALEQLRHLRILTMFRCRSLASLPSLSHLEMLQEKDV